MKKIYDPKIKKEEPKMKTFKIVMTSWGGTRRDMFTGLSEKDAVEICEGYGWEVAPDGGYVWDLEIEEED